MPSVDGFNAAVGGAVEALVHALDHHYDVVNKLLSGRATPSAVGLMMRLMNWLIYSTAVTLMVLGPLLRRW